MYFAHGESVLQKVCTEISNWPPLIAGGCVQLPLLGTKFQTYIPSLTSANLQQLLQQRQQNQRELASQSNNDEIPIEYGSECTIASTTAAVASYGSGINNESNANVDTDGTEDDPLANNTSIIYNECDSTANENESKPYGNSDKCDTDTYSYLSQMSLTKTTLVLASVHEIDIFRSLSSVLPYIHLLWELVLTAEPIVVMASSPSDCSHMVQSLTR